MKKIITIALSMLILVSICGCGNTMKYQNAENPISEKLASEATTVESGIVADNNKFSLLWDSENVCIQLINKITGEKWSSTPCDTNGLYLEDPENLFSPLDIEYILYSGYNTIKCTGKKHAVINGVISAKKIENGIKVTFIFSEHRIAIPVNFILIDDGLQASINMDEIVEDYADKKVFRITILPYFCSSNNSKDNYLFIPSGSGSLMFTDERSSGTPREFEGKVYGEDPTQEIPEKHTSASEICMPVYGVKVSNSTISAIITSGAGKSYIYAQAGSKSLGCSYVNNSFQIRGHNRAILQYGGATGKKFVEQYTREMDDSITLSVEYKPSVSVKAQGYNFIAEEYRKHLSNKYDLKKNNENSELALKFFGGIQIKKHIFGIPYSKVEPLTTFDDVKNILSDINSYTKNIDVQLVGFGKSGIDVGELGGGFTFSKELGNSKSVMNLQKYCLENSFELYYDYDLISFNKSNNGFSPSSDNSSTANDYPAKLYKYSAVTGSMVEDSSVAAILSRSRLEDAVKKAVNSTQKLGVRGISLSSLSNIAYSDYSSKMKYSNCSLIDTDIKEYFKYINDNKIKIATSAANDYAAVVSNKIFDSPSNDSLELSMDCSVPFYQMVFKGYVNQSLDSINTSTNSRKQVLKSVETGTALQYSLISNYSSEYAFYNHEDLQFMVYQNNVDNIISTLEECSDFLESVKKASISEHILINPDVRKTVFDNGITVFVNYGDKDYIDSEITVESMGFKVR